MTGYPSKEPRNQLRVPASRPTTLARNPVLQVSKPAVSPISKSAACESGWRARTLHGSQVWKRAIQQTWKSAVQPRRLAWFQECPHAPWILLVSPTNGAPCSSRRRLQVARRRFHLDQAEINVLPARGLVTMNGDQVLSRLQRGFGLSAQGEAVVSRDVGRGRSRPGTPLKYTSASSS